MEKSRLVLLFTLSLVLALGTFRLFGEILPDTTKEVAVERKLKKETMSLKDLRLGSHEPNRVIRRMPASVTEPYSTWTDPNRPVFLYGACRSDSGRFLGPFNQEYADCMNNGPDGAYGSYRYPSKFMGIIIPLSR